MTAVAAATSGETRWVRPPLPCRPSKLRLDVDAARSPGLNWSGFMPRHIEQPAARHSAPASLKTTSRPSDSACSRTRAEPGTTSIRTESATWWPLITSAAARRSSIRPLVQEPRNTVSTAISRIRWPGCSAMYSSALVAAVRSASSAKVSGSGTAAPSGTPWPGLVPQVTNGVSWPRQDRPRRRRARPGRSASVCQYATAASQSSPSGACGRPFR